MTDILFSDQNIMESAENKLDGYEQQLKSRSRRKEEGLCD